MKREQLAKIMGTGARKNPAGSLAPAGQEQLVKLARSWEPGGKPGSGSPEQLVMSWEPGQGESRG